MFQSLKYHVLPSTSSYARLRNPSPSTKCNYRVEPTIPLVSTVQISVSARNLWDRDIFSESDPFCIMYQKDPKTKEYIEKGRTEVINNCLNPTWNKKFTLDYRFEERQIIKFTIYDMDGDSSFPENNDYLGSLECSLGEVMASPNRKYEKNLDLPEHWRAARRSSQIIIEAEELDTNKQILHMKMSAFSLDKKNLFAKRNPFVVISKEMDDGSWRKVVQTEFIRKTLKPKWKPISVRLFSLNNGNTYCPIKFQVYDWKNSGDHDFIGEFITSYSDICIKKALRRESSFPIINQMKKRTERSYNNSGTLSIDWIRIEENKSFLDYIGEGLQLDFTVAIDFTKSNGNPKNPKSLHYSSPHKDNQYTLAIKAIGEIIQDYDWDKRYYAYGFGAIVPPLKMVSHNFPLHGLERHTYCEGVNGILQAYTNTLNNVQLSGPTCFAHVINNVAQYTASFLKSGSHYLILLIITDGIIDDIDATKKAIINASALPMSIIILGVGNANFDDMHFLDSNGKPLVHNGRRAVRDIVQFVEMRRFFSCINKKCYGIAADVTGKYDIGREVLSELPEQVVCWMKMRSELPI